MKIKTLNDRDLFNLTNVVKNLNEKGYRDEIIEEDGNFLW